MSVEKKTMEQILLEPLDMPIVPIEITTPLKKVIAYNNEQGKYGSLFSTKVDAKLLVPSKDSLTIFAPTVEKKVKGTI